VTGQERPRRRRRQALAVELGAKVWGAQVVESFGPADQRVEVIVRRGDRRSRPLEG
jgi:hypothetical protein